MSSVKLDSKYQLNFDRVSVYIHAGSNYVKNKLRKKKKKIEIISIEATATLTV